MSSNSQKRKRLSKSKRAVQDRNIDDEDNVTPTHVSMEEGEDTLKRVPSLPADTPAWDLTLLEIIKGEFRTVTDKMDAIEVSVNTNSRNV